MRLFRRCAAALTAMILTISGFALGETYTGERPLSDYFAGDPAALTEEPAALNEDRAFRSDRITGQHTAKVYDGRLDRFETLEVAEVEGYEDVPFVSVRSYLKGLFGNDVSFRMEKENNRFLIGRNGAVAELVGDPLELRCDNWYAFFRSTDPNTVTGMVETRYSDATRPSVIHANTVTTPAFPAVSLAYDGIGAVFLDRDVLLPFCVLQTIFSTYYPDSRTRFIYNGDDFFRAMGREAEPAADETSAYDAALHSGRFSLKEKASPAYAKYNYACLCLMIDLYFGHKAELGIESFDGYAESVGLKEGLSSDDPKTCLAAIYSLQIERFDSGHDGFASDRCVFAGDPVILERALLPAPGDKRTQLEDTREHILSLRPEEYGNNTLVAFEDDTAFIYFESFERNDKRPYSYYVRGPQPDDIGADAFAMMYDAFRRIKERPEIRNVVIDVCANGGGESSAVVAILGFLSPDGEVGMTTRNNLADAILTEYYQVDTNLDGVFDEKDGYGGDYDFYIVTSGFSYSCATALPFFAMTNGLATVMGQPAGGGDCTVSEYYDAYGFGMTFSDFNQFGALRDGTFVSDENAVIPQIPFGDDADKIYYNRPAMVRLIHEYAR